MRSPADAPVRRSNVQIPADVRRALATPLNEVLDGPPGREAYMLNGGGRGLLGSLDTITAARSSHREIF
jgi:hypothetical protein